MVKILMISAKMAAPALLKIKVIWNKGYYIIYSVYILAPPHPTTPPPLHTHTYPEQGWKLMKIKELYSRFCSFRLYPGILNTEKKPSSRILKSRSAIDLDRVKKNRKHNFFLSLVCIGLHAKFKSIRWHLLPEEL